MNIEWIWNGYIHHLFTIQNGYRRDTEWIQKGYSKEFYAEGKLLYVRFEVAHVSFRLRAGNEKWKKLPRRTIFVADRRYINTANKIKPQI